MRTTNSPTILGGLGSKAMHWLVESRAALLTVLIVLTVAVMSILYPVSFFNFYNFSSILLELSILGILVVGMMLLLIGGVFDLSVGAGLAFSAAVVAALSSANPEMPLLLSILCGLLAGGLAGLVSGCMVALGVNALIATLAMMGILRGLAHVLIGTTLRLPDAIFPLGQKMIFGLQAPVYYFFIIVIVAAILLKHSAFLRQLFFIGDNRDAAQQSGIEVKKVIIIMYIVMGLLTAFAGIVLGARVRAAVGAMGNGMEMKVIAAVIIGGGSLQGGKGTILGGVMGATLMTLLQNVMIIANVSIYFQSVVVGLVLIGAVSLDVQLTRRRGR